MLHPFLSTLDDDYYYYTPRSYHENMRRAMALEDIRRREELERYYRAQNERRQRNHYQFGDDVYQALLQRQALEREAERQDYHHALRFLRGDDDEISGNTPSQGQEVDEGPIFRLMRGPDGRIYRVPLQKTNEKVSTSRSHPQMKKTPSTAEIPNEGFVKNAARRDTTIAQGSAEMPSMVTEQRESTDSENTHINGVKPGMNEEKNTMAAVSVNCNKRTKKVVTVTVEDASDIEEDDDLKSPWRNRRPSPGEWMEPVAMFDKIPR